jgi:glycerol-3-phosphate acyltransferase PlsY
VWREITAILGGYLVGSISAGYLLGKILKQIDIRNEGSGTASVEHVFRLMGLGPASVSAVFDLSKGVLVILFSSLFVSSLFSYLAGMAALIGHMFPFYLRFRGGHGTATGAGIFFYFMSVLISTSLFSWTPFLALLLCTLILVYVTRFGALAGLVVIPFFAAYILLESPLSLPAGFALALLTVGWILFMRKFIGREFRVLRERLSAVEKKEIKLWRTWLRPLAVLFPLFYLFFGKRFVLLLVGAITLFFFLFDISRLTIKKFNLALMKSVVIKQREIKVFSSMSFFLLASFIILLIYEKDIAILTIFFLTFGDLAAKCFGILYGRKKLFEKTLEGMLAYFAACLLFGFFWSYFLDISPVMIITGAGGAAIAEILPIGIDDNFTVGLISASLMYLVKVV